MNTLSRQPDPAADEQASLWAARLEGGTLSAADRDALDAWLNRDPSHRALLSRYCQFSADLEEQLLALVATGGVKLPPDVAGEAQVEAATGAQIETLPPPAVRRWNFKTIATVATLAAAAAVAVLLSVSRPKVRIETVATAAAQRSTITLSDGSRVELNARTSLTFENGTHERHLKLSSGEAFFTVAKDQARPFIIETSAGSVRVTGTVFNVKTDTSADLEVTVVEGSVQVRPSETAAAGLTEPFALVANDSLLAFHGKATQRKLTAEELDDLLAWRQGVVVFKDVPLFNVFKKFAAYHDKGIYPSAAIEQSDKTVSGRYNIDNLDDMFKTLGESFKLHPEYQANGTIRVKLNIER